MKWLRHRLTGREAQPPAGAETLEEVPGPSADGSELAGGAGSEAAEAVSDADEAALEADWVRAHVEESPQILREFLGGDGISLEGLTVLDLGCGDGLIDWGIATSQRPRRLVGVDLELTDRDQLLRRLRRQGLAPDGLPPSLGFDVCTPERLPFPDDTFDWVLSWSAFEHIHDPARSIREVRRVLKPHGGFFIQLYPFFWSEHGPHLEHWYPQGYPQRYQLDELMTRVSPAFAAERRVGTSAVQHSRHGNRQPGDQVIWEYLNLNRITLDDLQRALLFGGFWVSKAQLISPAVHVPMELNLRSLSEMLIAGVYLTAVPSPIHVTLPRHDDENGASGRVESR